MGMTEKEKYDRCMQVDSTTALRSLLWQNIKQTELLEGIRSHTRGIVAFIVAIIVLWFLAVLFMLVGFVR